MLDLRKALINHQNSVVHFAGMPFPMIAPAVLEKNPLKQ
jgi:hypothetical protein